MNFLLLLLAIDFSFCIGVSSRPKQISCFCPVADGSGWLFWRVIGRRWQVPHTLIQWHLTFAWNQEVEGVLSLSHEQIALASTPHISKQPVCLGPGEERFPSLPTVAVDFSCHSRVRSQVRMNFLPLHRSSLLLFCFRKRNMWQVLPCPQQQLISIPHSCTACAIDVRLLSMNTPLSMLPPSLWHKGSSFSSLSLSSNVTHGETPLKRSAEWGKLTFCYLRLPLFYTVTLTQETL